MEKLSPKESVEGADTVLRGSVRALEGFSESKPLGFAAEGSQGVRCQVSGVRCQVLGDTCHVPGVTCHMSCVMSHFFLFYKVLELVVGGSVINGAYPV